MLGPSLSIPKVPEPQVVTGSGTPNHVLESSKKTKSAGRSNPSPTVRGGQSRLNGSEVNFPIPRNVKYRYWTFQTRKRPCRSRQATPPGYYQAGPSQPPRVTHKSHANNRHPQRAPCRLTSRLGLNPPQETNHGVGIPKNYSNHCIHEPPSIAARPRRNLSHPILTKALTRSTSTPPLTHTP